MLSWASPAVPSLAAEGLGTAPAPMVHDTATANLVLLAPQPRARMYVCGITPYDATHLGHAATYVAFDLLQRAWRDSGRDVTYTQNVTDIDDPLLERAAKDDIGWRQLADEEVALFRSDMASLRVLAPDHFPGVVESMDLVVDVIARLHALGVTYRVDGDLYFSVRSDPGFGDLSGLDADQMRTSFAASGGDPDRRGKSDPLDWLLWRAERSGEPAWDSLLGRGRPGWHVECSAMAVEHLGLGFDVQGGGSDLLFPHHEMTAAEAHVAFGSRPFAQAYVHAGMVGLGGEKMSKSRGNLVLISRLLEDRVDPMALRLALLAHHYRDDWDWTESALPAAERRLDRWRSALHRDEGSQSQLAAGPVVEEVRAALAADLDAPLALAAVDRWADEVLTGAGIDAAGARTVAVTVDALLGVEL